MDHKELIEPLEWLRGFEIDHSPDGWPAIRMREISAMCNAVESLLAENERLKFEVDTKQLIPAEDVAREFSLMAKAVVMVLETLPDILERDCALTPTAVSRVQNVIDDLRDQMAESVKDAETEEEEPEED